MDEAGAFNIIVGHSEFHEEGDCAKEVVAAKPASAHARSEPIASALGCIWWLDV